MEKIWAKLQLSYEKESWISKLVEKCEDGTFKARYEIPRDEEDPRFVKSFTINQVVEYKEFFNRFGFVVVRDILTTNECEETINDIWQVMETHPLYMRNKINRNDPSTYVKWPHGMASIEGIIGEQPIFTKTSLQNRQNPNFYSVYSNLLDDPHLIVNHDRYGLFRPTKGTGMKRFATMENIHFDFSPFSYVLNTAESVNQTTDAILNSLEYKYADEIITENNYLYSGKLSIQALINFQDNFEDDGGFQLVPGIANHLNDWVNDKKHLKNSYGDSTFVVIQNGELLCDLAQRITLRAGSAIFWNQMTAHGSKPNNSSNFRYAQFFKMIPVNTLNHQRFEKRRKLVLSKLNVPDFEITPLGRKIFGIDRWDDNNNNNNN